MDDLTNAVQGLRDSVRNVIERHDAETMRLGVEIIRLRKECESAFRRGWLYSAVCITIGFLIIEAVKWML